MKQHMQTLVNLLVKNDLEAMLQHYLDTNAPENIEQLAFLFQQGQITASTFEFYQAIATKFVECKGLPSALIAQIKTNDLLSFFTPALQFSHNFSQTNQQQRNVLHYLFSGQPSGIGQSGSVQSAPTNPQPPFNYLRSMMLFGSNESLRDALCQRDAKNFTPIEDYLLLNTHLTVLPTHELTALLALIEIESKQQPVDNKNYVTITQTVGKLCRSQNQIMSVELQRLILIAAYYTKPIQRVLKDID